MAKRKFKDPYDVRPATSNERRGGGAYWRWCEKHCPVGEFDKVIEPRGANPDQFNRERESLEDGEMLAAVKHVLNTGGLQKLSTRQRRVFKLVLIEGMTYAEAGKRMSISPMTVHEHVRAAGKKLKKLCEDIL